MDFKKMKAQGHIAINFWSQDSNHILKLDKKEIL